MPLSQFKIKFNSGEDGFRHYSNALQKKIFSQSLGDQFPHMQFHWQLIMTCLCISKVLSMLIQWGEFIVKNATFDLHKLSWVIFHHNVCFCHKLFSFSFLFWWSFKLSVELHVKIFIITTQSNDGWCFHSLKKSWNTVHY